ncbi:MAG: phosphoenolpyruvate carboxykinase (ATP) [Candidatus Kapaibacteriota bacterium]
MARKPPSRIAKKKASSANTLAPTENVLEQEIPASPSVEQGIEPTAVAATEQDSVPPQAPLAPKQAHGKPQSAAKQQQSVQAPKQPNQPAPKPEPAGQILPLPQFLAQKHGLHNLGQIFHNLSTPELYEHILFLREGVMSADGAVMVETTPHTKLAVRDKFIVEEEINKEHIGWGEANRAIEQSKFNALKARLGAYLQRRNVYVQDCFLGSDTRLRVPMRFVTENAWQSLFVRNTFSQALPAELRQFDPRMTIIVLPGFKAIPEIDGTRAETFVLYDFSQRLAIIGGTRHAEEIKKAAFTVMSYAMPLRRVLPMRCSATVGASGDTVLLFGTNGAGKTTLSADPARTLVGDDANGWGDDGVFAFESGGYAKTLGVTPETDASIYAMSRAFGSILENVKFDPATRQPNLADTSISDNARISYSLGQFSTVQPIAPKLRSPHPKNAIILVNDAFGVLPPVARLTQEQAMFFYLSGYGAKNPVGDAKTEPRAVFSAGFGETFMLQDPISYAMLFRERLRRNNTKVWLVNTGWQGGTQATGSRIKRDYSRAIVAAITSGTLDSVAYANDTTFNLSVPATCPGVPAAMLNPRNAWSDRNAYDKTAQKLVQLLTENFKKYVGRIDKAVAQALVANSQPAQKQVPQAAKAVPVNAPAPIAAEISSENVPLENASEASTQALSGKKAAPAKKAKPPKKLRAKEIIPPEEEAEVGDTGLDISIDEQYPSNDDSNIVIPPGLFATEPQGEFRPDDESPMIASAFDDDEEDDASEQSGEQDGQSDDDPNRPQGQFKGNRRRRGGRGRRRPH